MVDLPATDDEKKDALIEIAKTYELHENYPKAIAMYERINTLFSGDPTNPSACSNSAGSIARSARTNWPSRAFTMSSMPA